MSRFLLAATLLACATPAMAVDRSYSVTDFDRVEVDGPYQVALSTGGPSSAKASGDRQAIDRLDVNVQGGTLRIRPNPSAWGGFPGARSGTATITLTTRSLRAATVNGAGVLTIDKARAMQFDIAVIGSGQAKVSGIDADSLRAALLGSGSLLLAGKTKTLRAEVHGSGSLDAAALTAADAVVVSDTAGPIKVNAARSANVTSNGLGDVDVAGSAACTVKQIGSGRVHCGGN
jgi:hypothetical protein